MFEKGWLFFKQILSYLFIYPLFTLKKSLPSSSSSSSSEAHYLPVYNGDLPKNNNLIPVQKLDNALSQCGEKTKVILLATGAFSPIHVMHTHMLEAAKQHLEDNGNDKYEVVAGYVSPSHDEYVHRKLGDDWIPIEHRFEMCELALQYSSWISLSRVEGTRSRFSYIDSMLVYHDEFFKSHYPNHKLQIMFVCGADLAVRSGGLGSGIVGYPVLVLGRPSWREKLQERLKDRPPEPGMFFFADEDLKDVSSTEIRKRLKTEGELYELMAPEAADYLKNVYKKFEK